MLKKAQNGNRQAFESLFSPYLKVVYNYICFRVQNREDANDILQNTLLAAWMGVNRLKTATLLKAWVMGIAKRKIADCFRAGKKQAALPLGAETGRVGITEEAESVGRRLDMAQALACLKEKESELVYLIFSARFTYSETAEILNIPLGTVKSRMAAVKAKLRASLRPEKEG